MSSGGATSAYKSDAISIRLKRKPLIILNARFVQKLLVFLTPFRAMMVRRLVTDVLRGLVKMSVIDREGTVAFLPGKAFIILLVQSLDPLATVGFDVSHEVD